MVWPCVIWSPDQPEQMSYDTTVGNFISLPPYVGTILGTILSDLIMYYSEIIQVLSIYILKCFLKYFPSLKHSAVSTHENKSFGNSFKYFRDIWVKWWINLERYVLSSPRKCQMPCSILLLSLHKNLQRIWKHQYVFDTSNTLKHFIKHILSKTCIYVTKREQNNLCLEAIVERIQWLKTDPLIF